MKYARILPFIAMALSVPSYALCVDEGEVVASIAIERCAQTYLPRQWLGTRPKTGMHDDRPTLLMNVSVVKVEAVRAGEDGRVPWRESWKRGNKLQVLLPAYEPSSLMCEQLPKVIRVRAAPPCCDRLPGPGICSAQGIVVEPLR